MLKKLALTLINKVFGLKLTEADLDGVIEFIKMLISLFGGKEPALQHLRKVTVKTKQMGKDQAKAKLVALEK